MLGPAPVQRQARDDHYRGREERGGERLPEDRARPAERDELASEDLAYGQGAEGAAVDRDARIVAEQKDVGPGGTVPARGRALAGPGAPARRVTFPLTVMLCAAIATRSPPVATTRLIARSGPRT